MDVVEFGNDNGCMVVIEYDNEYLCFSNVVKVYVCVVVCIGLISEKTFGCLRLWIARRIK